MLLKTVYTAGVTQEVTERNNSRATEVDTIPVIFWGKNSVCLCFSSRNMPKAKLKSNGLISLVQESSRLTNIKSMASLLLITLM